MTKIIFLLGWFCLDGDCVNIKEKHQFIEDCKEQGILLKSMLDEYNIRRYHFGCVDITNYGNS